MEEHGIPGAVYTKLRKVNNTARKPAHAEDSAPEDAVAISSCSHRGCKSPMVPTVTSEMPSGSVLMKEQREKWAVADLVSSFM